MFHDDAGWIGKGFDAFQRRIGIGHVVEGQFLALQHLCGAHARLGGAGFTVKGGALVGVFAVAHFLHFLELHVEGARECAFAAIGLQGAQIVGNHAVVTGGVFKGSQRQFEAGAVAEDITIGLHFFQNAAIVGRIHQNADPFMVLG